MTLELPTGKVHSSAAVWLTQQTKSNTDRYDTKGCEMKQIQTITVDQCVALSFSPFVYRSIKTDKRGNTQIDDDGAPIKGRIEIPRFIKPGEPQKAAITRLMNQRRAAIRKAHAVNIPSFTPGVTTTMQYVSEFERINKLVSSGSSLHQNNPAPLNEGEECIVTFDFDEAFDLI